ncbi:hypothetical protein pb186bvf_009802 [Paramecium bursaria]
MAQEKIQSSLLFFFQYRHHSIYQTPSIYYQHNIFQFQTYAEANAYMNQLTGSGKSMWHALEMKRYYHPEYSSTAVTAAYLWKIVNQQALPFVQKETQQRTLLKHSTKASQSDEIPQLIQMIWPINEKMCQTNIGYLIFTLALNFITVYFKKPFEDAEIQPLISNNRSRGM